MKTTVLIRSALGTRSLAIPPVRTASFICSTCRHIQTTPSLNAVVKKRKVRLARSPTAREAQGIREDKTWILTNADKLAKRIVLRAEENEQYWSWWVSESISKRLSGWTIDQDILLALFRWTIDNRNASKEDFLAALDAFKIPLMAIVPLGRVLFKGTPNGYKTQKYEDAGVRWFASQLMFHASNAGSVYATCYIVQRAIVQDKLDLPEIKQQFEKLKRIANVDKNTAAMILIAQVHTDLGENEEALELLKEAAELLVPMTDQAPKKPLQPTSEDELGSLHGGRALRDLGNVYFNAFDDIAKAEEAWTRAALEYDDAQSYTYLSMILSQEKKYTKEWFNLTLKAATGAHFDSTYEIGMLYFSCVDRVKRQAIMDAGLREEIENVMDASLRGNIFTLFSSQKFKIRRARKEFGVSDEDFPLAVSLDLVESAGGTPLHAHEKISEFYRQDRLIQMAMLWLSVASVRGHIPSILAACRMAWTVGDGITAANQLCSLTLWREGWTFKDVSKESRTEMVYEYERLFQAIQGSELGRRLYERQMDLIKNPEKQATPG